MFEESVESFVARWRSDAAEVQLFPRVENDPMLEFEAGGTVMQALERTGPYLAQAGPGRIIVNATTHAVALAEDAGPALELTGISRGRARGRVLRCRENFLVVDAGFRLVLGVREPLPEGLAEGAMVVFEIEPPLHAFVLAETRRQLHGDEV